MISKKLFFCWKSNLEGAAVCDDEEGLAKRGEESRFLMPHQYKYEEDDHQTYRHAHNDGDGVGLILAFDAVKVAVVPTMVRKSIAFAFRTHPATSPFGT